MLVEGVYFFCNERSNGVISLPVEAVFEQPGHPFPPLGETGEEQSTGLCKDIEMHVRQKQMHTKDYSINICL